jgi:uncharacterized membrane protein
LKSYVDALFWLRKAAEQGHADAQNLLGICHYNGRGVERSHEGAVKWFRKAAEQGHAWAQYNLANCYYNGKGVEQSYEEAMKWYRKAAEQGNADAQYNLGTCYYKGQGVEQSYEGAVSWYRKAAEQGYTGAIEQLKKVQEEKLRQAQENARQTQERLRQAQENARQAQENARRELAFLEFRQVEMAQFMQAHTTMSVKIAAQEHHLSELRQTLEALGRSVFWNWEYQTQKYKLNKMKGLREELWECMKTTYIESVKCEAFKGENAASARQQAINESCKTAESIVKRFEMSSPQ